jgi:hypothetical protein
VNTDRVLDSAFPAEVETDFPGLNLDMMIAHCSETERTVLLRVLLIANSNQRLFS